MRWVHLRVDAHGSRTSPEGIRRGPGTAPDVASASGVGVESSLSPSRPLVPPCSYSSSSLSSNQRPGDWRERARFSRSRRGVGSMSYNATLLGQVNTTRLIQSTRPPTRPPVHSSSSPPVHHVCRDPSPPPTALVSNCARDERQGPAHPAAAGELPIPERRVQETSCVPARDPGSWQAGAYA